MRVEVCSTAFVWINAWYEGALYSSRARIVWNIPCDSENIRYAKWKH